MQHHLFVYGTLMRRAATAGLGVAERQRLWAESALVGKAAIQARLYDFGAYPGLVPVSDDTSAIVHGELLRLTDPAATFTWLDVYEMIVPGDEATNEYVRVLTNVTAGGGAAVEAWVYAYQRDVGDHRPIPGGLWM
jgi:gamma-glutamylcyclotransferase (GGCT)/AIG2-like uncharacterized protein YtfP